MFKLNQERKKERKKPRERTTKFSGVVVSCSMIEVGFGSDDQFLFCFIDCLETRVYHFFMLLFCFQLICFNEVKTLFASM
ncbi:hypothetical protein BDC45DRAFT_499533 [Circinella umbellata]|nr:hypothetical protein BDC45DRAFT_499533 [Circinella umbellata]